MKAMSSAPQFFKIRRWVMNEPELPTHEVLTTGLVTLVEGGRQNVHPVPVRVWM